MAASIVREARGGRSFASALDAGCGTGLAGPYLRPIVAGVLSGVDISAKMLDLARPMTTDAGAPVYDVLLAKDLLQLTRADVAVGADGGTPSASARDVLASGVELIAAADVLVYFGELTSLLRAFSDLAAPASTIIFTCERTDADAPAGWRLLSSGRFAHTKEYVVREAAAHGYRLQAYKEIVPRTEYGHAVHGHIFVFERG